MSLTVGGCGNKEKKDVQIENNELEQSQEPINNGKDYLLVYYKDKQGESLLAKKIAIKKMFLIDSVFNRIYIFVPLI